MEEVVSGTIDDTPKINTEKLLADVVSGGETNNESAASVAQTVLSENKDSNHQQETVQNQNNFSENIPTEPLMMPMPKQQVQNNSALIGDTFSFNTVDINTNKTPSTAPQNTLFDANQQTPMPAAQPTPLDQALTSPTPAQPQDLPEFEPIASTETTQIQTETYQEANIKAKKAKEFNPDSYKLPVLLALALAFAFMTYQIVPQAFEQDVGILIVVLVVFGGLWIVLGLAIIKNLKKK